MCWVTANSFSPRNGLKRYCNGPLTDSLLRGSTKVRPTHREITPVPYKSSLQLYASQRTTLRTLTMRAQLVCDPPDSRLFDGCRAWGSGSLRAWKPEIFVVGRGARSLSWLGTRNLDGAWEPSLIRMDRWSAKPLQDPEMERLSGNWTTFTFQR